LLDSQCTGDTSSKCEGFASRVESQGRSVSDAIFYFSFELSINLAHSRYNFEFDPRSLGAKVVLAADESSYVGECDSPLLHSQD